MGYVSNSVVNFYNEEKTLDKEKTTNVVFSFMVKAVWMHDKAF